MTNEHKLPELGLFDVKEFSINSVSNKNDLGVVQEYAYCVIYLNGGSSFSFRLPFFTNPADVCKTFDFNYNGYEYVITIYKSKDYSPNDFSYKYRGAIQKVGSDDNLIIRIKGSITFPVSYSTLNYDNVVFFVICKDSNKAIANIFFENDKHFTFDIPYYKTSKDACRTYKFEYNNIAYIMNVFPTDNLVGPQHFGAAIQRYAGADIPFNTFGTIAE